MSPRFPRAPAIAAVAFAVWCVVRWTVPVDRGPALALHSLPMMVLYPAISFSLADRLRALQHRSRWPSFLWALLFLVVGGSMAMGAFWTINPEVHRTGMVVLSAPVMLWIVGVTSAAVGAFDLIGAAIHAMTVRARSLSRRLVALGIACAGLGAFIVVLLQDLMPADAGMSRAVAVVTSMISAIPVVIGFSLAISTPLTESVRSVVLALRSVAAGELSVRLPERGRDELSEISRAFNGMTEQLREKDFLERAFGRYVAVPVLDQLRRDRTLSMETTRREATVLYADIRGFTSFSESSTPEEVMLILNTYFTRILEVVDAHQGYVNKFIGDALMVVFNAPVDQPDHPRRALACACDMQAALAKMNADRRFGERQLQIGIGVNTGPLVAGSLGGEQRSEYTVIGDTVNVAARLTSQAGPGEVYVGAATAAANDAVPLAALPPLPVKGKAAPLQAFRVESDWTGSS